MRKSNVTVISILLALGVGSLYYLWRNPVAKSECSAPARETKVNTTIAAKKNDSVDNKLNSRNACGTDPGSSAAEPATHVAEMAPVRSVGDARANNVTGVANGGPKMETTDKKPLETGLTNAEMQSYIRSASDELARMQVPIADRKPSVTVNENEVIITFEPPKGARAGAFIIKIDKFTKKIKDTKIWR